MRDTMQFDLKGKRIIIDYNPEVSVHDTMYYVGYAVDFLNGNGDTECKVIRGRNFTSLKFEASPWSTYNEYIIDCWENKKSYRFKVRGE